MDGDGLMLVVTSKSSASWKLRAMVAGKRRDIGLGSLKVLFLAEARDKASDLRRQIAERIDPIVERKKIADPVPTFREAAASIHKEHKAAWKNGKHQDQWINTLTTYTYPQLGDLLVNDIEGPIIARCWRQSGSLSRKPRGASAGASAPSSIGASLGTCFSVSAAQRGATSDITPRCRRLAAGRVRRA